MESVDINTNEREIFVFINSEKLNYYSAYDNGRDVSEAVPWFIYTGHKDSTGVDNWFHNYPKSYFLEVAQENIKKEFPYLDIQIVANPPTRV